MINDIISWVHQPTLTFRSSDPCHFQYLTYVRAAPSIDRLRVLAFLPVVPAGRGERADPDPDRRDRGKSQPLWGHS